MITAELQFYVTAATFGLTQKRSRTTQKLTENLTEIAQCMFNYRVKSFTYDPHTVHFEGERDAHYIITQAYSFIHL